MQQPVQITIRDIPHSNAVETHIRKKAEKLNQFCDDIISCHIVIELTQKSQHQGKLYNVRINVFTPPQKEFAVTRFEREDLYVAIRDAFDSMAAQLKEYSQQIRGHSKTHPEVISGTIVRLFDQDQFGFIRSADGEEYYFNSGNVQSQPFDKLKVGLLVHFIEAVAGDGLQAHRVTVSKKKLRKIENEELRSQ